jgi:hypothetical protein
MASTVDPTTTTTIDRIMDKLELPNQRMHHCEDLRLSIMVKLGLLPPTQVKMQSSSPKLVPPPVLWPVEVTASLVVEPLLLVSPTPESLLPLSGSRHHRAWLLHLTAGSGRLLRVPKPVPPLPRSDLICLKEHESALPLVGSTQ